MNSSSHPSQRPQPGPAHVRPIWDGENLVAPSPYAPPPEPEPAPRFWTKDRAFGSKTDPRRIVGLDAARGFALLGMIAIHVLPAYNEYTGEPTFIWTLFAGHAAALFAVLAGITVALLTGGSRPHVGSRRKRSRTSLITRALLIFVLGLLLDQLHLTVYNILPYYGLMFLLAVPLISLRIRYLQLGVAAFATLGPVAVFLTNQWGGYTTILNPQFSDLFNMPVDTFITLFIGGTYPAATWMTYLCLGMAVGRLNLHWLINHVNLIIVGGFLSVVGFVMSTFLVDYAGGFRQLYYYSDGYEAQDITDIIDYGPQDHLPTDTWWWLTINGPHTNTPFSILSSAGLALVLIGVFLVTARVSRYILEPLISIGSMSLTLYTVHLLSLFLFSSTFKTEPVLWFIIQVLGALIFGVGWHLAVGRGPLESVISRTCSRVAVALVPDSPEPVITEAKSS